MCEDSRKKKCGEKEVQYPSSPLVIYVLTQRLFCQKLSPQKEISEDRNNYKGHMDKNNGAGVETGEGGGDGWGGRDRWGGKAENYTCTTIKVFNQKINF